MAAALLAATPANDTAFYRFIAPCSATSSTSSTRMRLIGSSPEYEVPNGSILLRRLTLGARVSF